MSPSEGYEKIYRYCYFKTGNRALSEDLTQEAFLRYFSQSSYIERGKQLAYLYTIARNLCADSYRKKGSEVLDEEIPAPDEMDGVERRIAVREALAALPKEEQELLLLRYVNDLSVGEVCRITGLSRFAVYRRINAALAVLKSRLKEGDFFG